MAVTITIDLALLDRIYTGFILSTIAVFFLHWALKYAKVLLNIKDPKKQTADVPWRQIKVHCNLTELGVVNRCLAISIIMFPISLSHMLV